MEKDLPVKILLVEDNPADARMIDILLTEGSFPYYQLTRRGRLAEAADLLSREEFDLLLLDLSLPDASGNEGFLALHRLNDKVPIVILTGQKKLELGQEMVRAGAQSYLNKGDLSPELLCRALQHSIERQQLICEITAKHDEIRRTQEQFRALIEGNADAILVVDDKNIICYANAEAVSIFRANGDELVGYSFEQTVVPGQSFEFTLRKTKVSLEANVAPIEWEGQQSYLVTLRNVTQRKQLEETLSKEKLFLKSIVDGVKDPIVVTDMHCQLLLKNKASLKLESIETEGVNWPFRCYEADRLRSKGCDGTGSCLISEVRKSAVPTRVVKEIEIKNAPTRYFDVNITPLYNSFGEVTGTIEASRDITDRLSVENSLRRNQEKMRFLALHDSLTGLPNRLLFKDRLQRAIIESRRNVQKLALLFLDLDRFKHINDSLGHDYGDSFLKEIAARLKKVVRESDSVARLGGDEFVVLLGDIKESRSVEIVAKKILKRLSRALKIDHHEHFPSASIGISIFPTDADSAEDLMKYSDSAMYLAKEMGRGGYQFFNAGLKAHADKMVTLETALSRAIVSDQLILHYQPQCDLKTGKTVGFEALVRWLDPVRGLIPPNDFIPVAEDTGLIIPLGEWVLNKACRDHKSWLDQGMPPMRMSVNISPRQFHHEGLLQMVQKALKTSGLKPEFLELEITESSIMYDTNHAIEVMHRLRALGIDLAIDDFGSGYSSLLRLMDFPITKLKIDRGFVKNLGDDPNSDAFTKVIISLARVLKLEVVAEGVENQEQADILIKNGCRTVQGYFYGCPQPWDQGRYPVTARDLIDAPV
ncbi:MAG: EAL domain-containing protein [Desulfuromonadales bacterium]|nr:EAL domain-containing protein [Desulfuromonadales bacterium]